jgi:hypothetical protein
MNAPPSASSSPTAAAAASETAATTALPNVRELHAELAASDDPFRKALSMNTREKMDQFSQFAEKLNADHNASVARGFFITAVALFVVPLTVMATCVLAKHLVGWEGVLGFDPLITGGIAATACVIAISVGFAVVALQDAPVNADSRHASRRTREKKRQ